MKYTYFSLLVTLSLFVGCKDAGTTTQSSSDKTIASNVAPATTPVETPPTTEPAPKIDTLKKVEKPKAEIKKEVEKPKKKTETEKNTTKNTTKDKKAVKTSTKTKKKAPKKPNAKFVTLRFDKNTVPKSLKFLGKPAGGAHWKDKGGEHWVVLSEIEPYDSDTEGKDAEIYAYKFSKVNEKDTSFKQVWKEHDFVTRCDFNLVCGFLKGTNITDLDADGIGEVTFLYKTGCRREKVPMKLKLVMYEGSRKYTMQGTTVIVANEIDAEKLDETRTKEGAWASLPEEITEFADKKWKNNLLE